LDFLSSKPKSGDKSVAVGENRALLVSIAGGGAKDSERKKATMNAYSAVALSINTRKRDLRMASIGSSYVGCLKIGMISKRGGIELT
jgi:hypothetical protein